MRPARSRCRPRRSVLTSVMLALHPELVDLRSVERDLADEVAGASPALGVQNLERFIDSIVEAVRRAHSSPGGAIR